MKKILIAIFCTSVFATILVIILFRNTEEEQDIKSTEEIKAVTIASKQYSGTYTPIFEASSDNSVNEIKNISEDTPDNYNGIFIVTDDTNLINLATIPISNSDIKSLILLNDNQAWSYLTDGAIEEYPLQPYIEIKNTFTSIHSKYAKTISVKVWYWTNPSDITDMSKKTVTLRMTVHEKLADIFVTIFNDIYNDKSKPVIDISDNGFGTWVVRGKNHSDYNTVSAHALGAAIDINPGTPNYTINGIVYGNGYLNKAMPESIWAGLQENHYKYQILYENSPIVKTFKKYGFYWGGDWDGGSDPMHLAYLGDKCGRKKGIENYKEVNHE